MGDSGRLSKQESLSGRSIWNFPPARLKRVAVADPGNVYCLVNRAMRNPYCTLSETAGFPPLCLEVKEVEVAPWLKPK